MTEWLFGLILLAVFVAIAIGLYVVSGPPRSLRRVHWHLPSEHIALWWRRKKGGPGS